MEKQKRECELKRLLALIGMTKLLIEDCIPEKQAILEEVNKQSDAPAHPNPFIMFGAMEF